jgi:hypothetical protein
MRFLALVAGGSRRELLLQPRSESSSIAITRQATQDQPLRLESVPLPLHEQGELSGRQIGVRRVA